MMQKEFMGGSHIMKRIKILTDSHSGISIEEATKLDIGIILMPFTINGVAYLEGQDITSDEFYEKLREGVDVSTSLPEPGSLIEAFDKYLSDYDEIVYIPISSGLSGSCNSAMIVASYDEYAGRVFVVDNGRVSTPLHRSVLDAIELVNEGYSGEEIKDILEKNRQNMAIYVALDNMEYLKRGGRVSATASLLANALNIKPVLYFDTGLLSVVKKCRGMRKARHEMILAMKHDLETRFLKWYEKGQVYLLAASSATKEVTLSWIDEIKEAFPDMEVVCDPLSMGLSCHIGPDGLGIGCSCRPER